MGWIRIFEQAQVRFQQLTNTKLRDKILTYRSVQTNLGPANIGVVVYCRHGHTDEVSREFRQEARAICKDTDDIFDKFELLTWGCDELVEQINIAESGTRKSMLTTKILYDANNPSVIKYRSEGLSGIVCSASGREIARIIELDPSGFIFDSNVRKFLGSRGAVNADIHDTCTSKSDSHLFWFLNNGLTIACRPFRPDSQPYHACGKIRICRSSTAAERLHEPRPGSLRQGTPEERFSAAPNLQNVREYTCRQDRLTTNNQNKITSRDLRSNDSVQIDMQRRFDRYGILCITNGSRDNMIRSQTSMSPALCENELVMQRATSRL